MYRTRTYIAADWDGDIDAVNALHNWNNGKKMESVVYRCT